MDRTFVGHLDERFAARARALVYARLAFMFIGLLVLSVPAWREMARIRLPDSWSWYGAYLALLLIHIGSYRWVGRRHDRKVIFASLCVDLIVLLYLVAHSGGISSPLMPAQLVFTMIFALLFPTPLAIAPPLLMVPGVVRLEQLAGAHSLPQELMFVLWYSALNIIVVYIVVYLESREKAALQEVMRLHKARGERELADQRLRIAREIHDGVGAAISGVLLQAEYLTDAVSDAGVRGEIDTLRESAQEGMGELRRAVQFLHREFQLTNAVPEYVTAFCARHRLDGGAEVEGSEPEMEADIALALFRITQEALANVARHAQATRVDVKLDFAGHRVRLTVQDDGRGFDPKSAMTGHYGLRNMGERAAKVGGEFRIKSKPGEGALVEVALPRR